MKKSNKSRQQKMANPLPMNEVVKVEHLQKDIWRVSCSQVEIQVYCTKAQLRSIELETYHLYKFCFERGYISDKTQKLKIKDFRLGMELGG